MNNPGELEAVAKAILERVEEPVVITLTGDLGAGKTTLVQAFCKVLGVEEAVSSPSFSFIY